MLRSIITLMSEAQSEQRPLNRILDLLNAVLRADVVALVVKVVPLVSQWFDRPQGIYEVLDYDAQLELRDTKGKLAIYTRRQAVRFLQDNVIAYQDQAWGEGDIFADYKVSPGVPVDRYQEGYRYRILISLRQTKNRDDREEFLIERRIQNGFTREEGSFQTNIDHQTQNFSFSLIFPRERRPFELALVEQHAERTTKLGAEHLRQLPDGRWKVQWRKDRPQRLESYILRWKW